MLGRGRQGEAMSGVDREPALRGVPALARLLEAKVVAGLLEPKGAARTHLTGLGPRRRVVCR